jgi:ketosteroid isomerase-like protein
MDLDTVMSMFAANIVSFDIEPPLHHSGAEAKRKNWQNVFSVYQKPFEYQVHHLTITMGGGVAFARSLNRISGTTQDGGKTERWVRATTCWQKMNLDWLIVHDHVSVPLDLASGKALLDLRPGS